MTAVTLAFCVRQRAQDGPASLLSPPPVLSAFLCFDVLAAIRSSSLRLITGRKRKGGFRFRSEKYFSGVLDDTFSFTRAFSARTRWEHCLIFTTGGIERHWVDCVWRGNAVYIYSYMPVGRLLYVYTYNSCEPTAYSYIRLSTPKNSKTTKRMSKTRPRPSTEQPARRIRPQILPQGPRRAR